MTSSAGASPIVLTRGKFPKAASAYKVTVVVKDGNEAIHSETVDVATVVCCSGG